MHVAAGVVALLTCPTAAFACSCIGSGLVEVMPASDGVDLPPNSHVRLEYLRDEPGPHVLLEDGIPRDDVIEDLETHGEKLLVTLSTEDGFTPGALVEVFILEQEDPVVRFTVGTEPDETPPSWDGAFTVDNHRGPRLSLSSSSCARATGHVFEWIDLQDDVWPAEELVVVGIPDLDGASSFVDTADDSSVWDGGDCSHDDSTLLTDFHGVYDVFVEDGSGNRIGPFEVDTRAGCGCASNTPVAAGLWGVLVALATVRRRRHVR
jgi:MYXO-CTERM domain-containing protein